MKKTHAIKQNLCSHFVQYFLFCGNNTLKLLQVWVSHTREQHMQFIMRIFQLMRMFQTYFGWNLCIDISIHFILQNVSIFCVNQQLHF